MQLEMLKFTITAQSRNAKTGPIMVTTSPAHSCPAQTRDNVSCYNCGKCQLADRDYIVGFIPHGQGQKRVATIARAA